MVEGVLIYAILCHTTLFSKRSAHWFNPVFPVNLGHRPCPRVLSKLSNGLLGSFAYYSQDHLTSSTWPQVRVSDPGTSGELGQINVHFFWRRVYWEYMMLHYSILLHSGNGIHRAISRYVGRYSSTMIQIIKHQFLARNMAYLITLHLI